MFIWNKNVKIMKQETVNTLNVIHKISNNRFNMIFEIWILPFNMECVYNLLRGYFLKHIL